MQIKNNLTNCAKYCTLLGLTALVVACGDGMGDDLDEFIRDAGKGMEARVDDLPEVKPYSAFVFNADASLSDPFRSRKAKASSAGSLQPNLNRPRESLEAFPLESLKYVGLLSKKKLTYALIETPDKSVQQVRVGSYLGQNFGVVTSITESNIALKEIVQDDLTGDWVERTADVAVQQ